MEKIEKWITARLSAESDLLKKSFFFTCLWGLAAHGYMFLSNSITHDAVAEFVSNGDVMAHKIGLGRVLVPLVQMSRGTINAPWLLGLLSLFYLSLAVYFLIKMFAVRQKWKICLIAGVMTVNLTFISQIATFISDVDCNALAVLMAVLGAFLWRKGKWYGFIPVAVSMGLYQSFVSVTIVLIMTASILDLLREKPAAEVLVRGIKGAAMVVAGAVGYFVLLKLTVFLSGVSLSSGEYNDLSLMQNLTPMGIIRQTVVTWFNTIRYIITMMMTYPRGMARLIQCMTILIWTIPVVCSLFNKALSMGAKILLLILCAALPVGMNVAEILSNGMSHVLMHYGIWMGYLLPLLILGDWTERTDRVKTDLKKAIQLIAGVLVVLVLWSNLQVGNVVYTGKRYVSDANVSFFTRVLDRMESLPEYESGVTPVAIVGGTPKALGTLPEEYDPYHIMGFKRSYAVGTTDQKHFQSYFDYVMMAPVNIASDAKIMEMELSPVVAEMPIFPDAGSVAMVDGVLVVKLNETQPYTPES